MCSCLACEHIYTVYTKVLNTDHNKMIIIYKINNYAKSKRNSKHCINYYTDYIKHIYTRVDMINRVVLLCVL